MAQINLRVSDSVKEEMKKVSLANGFGGVSGYLKWIHNQFSKGEKCLTHTQDTLKETTLTP